jgi:hypothetical protein
MGAARLPSAAAMAGNGEGLWGAACKNIENIKGTLQKVQKFSRLIKSGGSSALGTPAFVQKGSRKPSVFSLPALLPFVFSYSFGAMLYTARKIFAALPSLISAAGSLPAALLLPQPPPLHQNLPLLERDAGLLAIGSNPSLPV